MLHNFVEHSTFKGSIISFVTRLNIVCEFVPLIFFMVNNGFIKFIFCFCILLCGYLPFYSVTMKLETKTALNIILIWNICRCSKNKIIYERKIDTKKSFILQKQHIRSYLKMISDIWIITYFYQLFFLWVIFDAFNISTLSAVRNFFVPCVKIKRPWFDLIASAFLLCTHLCSFCFIRLFFCLIFSLRLHFLFSFLIHKPIGYLSDVFRVGNGIFILNSIQWRKNPRYIL